MLVAVSEEYRALYIRCKNIISYLMYQFFCQQITYSNCCHLFGMTVADRLHTMRTLRSLPLDVKERLKIAEEALNVYAPLAHRMGVMKVKGELEDLAFKILHPEMFQVRNIYPININQNSPPYRFNPSILPENKIHPNRG